jgi:hypothetical protein
MDFTIHRHALSGSSASARLCESRSVIIPASNAHVRMNDLDPSCQIVTTQVEFESKV